LDYSGYRTRPQNVEGIEGARLTQAKVTPDDLALEKACIQRTQAMIEQMAQNVAGLEMLNRVHARLEGQIFDIRLALETVARLRMELWTKQRDDFERSKSLTEVAEEI
jgi:hypothetical protein